MTRPYPLAKSVLGSHLLEPGLLSHPDGSLSKTYQLQPLSSGSLEEGFEGAMSDAFFAKLSDLLSKLPNLFEGQILLCRRKEDHAGVQGLRSHIYCFEKVPKAAGYSHFNAVLGELRIGADQVQLIRHRGKPVRFHLGQAFIGQQVGLREEEDELWRVSFANYDLGFYDRRTGKFEPFDEPGLTSPV